MVQEGFQEEFTNKLGFHRGIEGTFLLARTLLVGSRVKTQYKLVWGIEKVF